MQSGTCRLPSILPRCLGTQWAPGRGLDCAPREEGAGPTGRTGGHGLSGRQSLMQGLIAQSSGSSPGPRALRLPVTLWAGAGESEGKAGSTWTSCSDAGHAVPGSPLHPPGWSQEVKSASSCACGNHGNYTPCRCQQTISQIPKEIKINLKVVTGDGNICWS